MRALRKTTELELGFLRIERANRIYLQGLTMCAQPPRNGQQVKYRYHLKEIYVYWKKKVAKNWYLKIFASSVLLKNRYVKYYHIII